MPFSSVRGGRGLNSDYLPAGLVVCPVVSAGLTDPGSPGQPPPVPPPYDPALAGLLLPHEIAAADRAANAKNNSRFMLTSFLSLRNG